MFELCTDPFSVSDCARICLVFQLCTDLFSELCTDLFSVSAVHGSV